MSRSARVVFPHAPYHVTQRGNHRADVFFCDEDRQMYLSLVARFFELAQLDLWAYCLMTNHIHLVVSPQRPDSMARGLGLAHGRYAQWLNQRLKRKGHVWEDRYRSALLDPFHLSAALYYVEQNSVRAGLCTRAEDYAWSSARARSIGRRDPLIASTCPWGTVPPRELIELDGEALASALARIRRATKTGRPLRTPDPLAPSRM